MFANKLNCLLMMLIISAFSVNAFSAWAVKRGATKCVGGTCYHHTTKGACVNGHCAGVRSGYRLHR